MWLFLLTKKANYDKKHIKFNYLKKLFYGKEKKRTTFAAGNTRI